MNLLNNVSQRYLYDATLKFWCLVKGYAISYTITTMSGTRYVVSGNKTMEQNTKTMVSNFQLYCAILPKLR